MSLLVPPVSVNCDAAIAPFSVSVMLWANRGIAPLLLMVMVYWAGSPTLLRASPVLSIVKLGGAETAFAWIWLSWLPREAPSSWNNWTWYGPPLMLPAPLPAP